MFCVPNEAPVFLRTGATDMRKSINGLSALVQYEMKKNPFAPGYYLFCSRSRKLLKILYWDRTGFALWYKRLEAERFAWPKDRDSVATITAGELEGLLSGIDYFSVHKEITFSCV